ncbi:MAG TPA: FecR family protein, partial [Candidatus Baltobacteraceae bacterium]|nr:FecR family protein [Candidatus Baltobacteraceae bacterium]
MKKLAAISFCFGCIAAISICQAIDLKQSKITQVVNDVQIISAPDQTIKKASVNDIFSMPDILRTGAASRAELVAQDQTVTRVGANTIFSFDPANRTIDLQQGSLLFHSPHGKGGGTIHTGAATASVLGTTLIVTTTPNGGMKVLDLEGEVEVKFLNGLNQKLLPGQMTFILPGGNQLAPIIIFRLDSLTENSLLVKGFTQPLTSWPLIFQQIENQLKLIKSGRETDTGLFAGDYANANQVQVLDPNTIQSDLNASGGISALNSDATINQPSLTDASIPTPPDHISVSTPFKLPGNGFFAGQSFRGFAAR